MENEEGEKTINGSRFDLNDGEIEFNRGYINGDIILQAPGGLEYTKWDLYGNTGTATILSASLSSILSELMSTVSRVEYLANYAIDIATTANSAIVTANSSINWLSNYFWDSMGGITKTDENGNAVFKSTDVIAFGHSSVKNDPATEVPALKVSSEGISLVASGTLATPLAQFTSGSNGFALSGSFALSVQDKEVVIDDEGTTVKIPGTYGTSLPTGWEGRLFFKLKS